MATAGVQPTEAALSAEAYLKMELASEQRHEFYFGKRTAMPGESITANELINNCLELLRGPLRMQGIRVFTHDIKLVVKNGQVYRYPDLMAVAATDIADQFVMEKPQLIVEVAAPDSYYTDRFVKWEEYKDLTSMRYYLVIAQDKMSVDFFRRVGENWESACLTKPEDALELPEWGLVLRLADLYAGV
jgi:Uma2 family endonuclease